MPMVHECNHLGCHAVIPSTEKFCQRHKQQEQQRYSKYNHQLKLQSDKQYNLNRRDQEANAFYHSARWTRTRDYIKQRDYMTDSVDGRVLNDHDYIVDHVVPRRLSDDPYDINNLWLLSRRHHNTKTRYEEQLSDDQLKTMTKTEWRRLINMKVGDNNG